VTASAIIFDLDGTLADSLGDIAAAMNHALVELGAAPHPTAAYRGFVGDGVERLAERALGPARQADRARAVSAYVRHYADHMLDTTRPYPGVAELLDALAERAVPMAVLSNKPEAATQRMVATLFARWRFVAVAGQRADVPRKPDPAAALALAAVLGRAPADVALVGDTAVDVATARAAGMVPVGSLWGFQDRAALEAAGATHLVTHPAELVALVSRRWRA
jgi:phosphoglycolate phosphatase